VEELVLAESGLGSRFDVVARIAAALERLAPARVVVPDVASSAGDERVVAVACAAALAWRSDIAVIVAHEGRVLAELDGPATYARSREALGVLRHGAPMAATAVISTWNKASDVCANLDALRAQLRPFTDIVVVDNASSDATARTIRERYPEVRLIVMPHSAYGACETFNLGFASAVTELTAILDDDVVLPADWLAKTVARLEREPATTAIVSSEVEEPGMPEGYLEQEHLRRERYMSTFRGCASLARSDAIRRAGYYDERLFIYGNERDLTCRLLNLGFRVLQFPLARAFHKTPFGIKMGKRSLYYHARNAWLTQLKYAPLGELLRLPWLVLTKVLLRGESRERTGEVSDATGTIGIGKSVRQTPGAAWVLAKAGASVLANLPYCWKHRAPCRAADFELPLK
jgi:GT2 family glycosyltransferase